MADLPTTIPAQTWQGGQQSDGLHAEWIAGRVQTLLSHYFQPDNPMDVQEAAIDDWIDALEPFSKSQIESACSAYIRDQPRRRPTPGDIRSKIGDEARLIAKDGPKGSAVGSSLDPVAINAQRIRRGEPAGDEWLFGSRAVSLLSQLTEDDLTPYRSGFYFNMVRVWGENMAQKREQEYRKKHDAARNAAGMPPLFGNGASVMIEGSYS